jgi:hypothetical protein
MRLRRKVSAPRPPVRNGYARVLARIIDLQSEEDLNPLRPSRIAELSTADEALLREGDEYQLGSEGIEIARHGSRSVWRDFLFTHFRRKYDLRVFFDSPELRVG